jgi:predicted RNA-binding protein with RPS1 domain
MIILFMDVYKVGSTGRVVVFGICNFGGFVSFLAGLFGFILAGDIHT